MTGRRTGTAGRDRERRNEERDYDERKEPAPTRKVNEYFIKGEGISREVLQGEICRFLGADAYSRPAKYDVCTRRSNYWDLQHTEFDIRVSTGS